MKRALVVGSGVAGTAVAVVLSIGLARGGLWGGETAAENASTVVAAAGKSYKPGDVYLKGSRVYAFVGKTGFGHQHGIEGKLKSGNLQLDAKSPGTLVFDMASFNADTPGARRYVGLKGTTDAGTRSKVNANMLGAAVLNVRAYPTATFTATKVTPLKAAGGRAQYRIDGKFTLHGTTNAVKVIANAETRGGWIHVRGRFAILQSDYGIKPFSKAFGAIGVADKLTIWGDLWIAAKRGRAGG